MSLLLVESGVDEAGLLKDGLAETGGDTSDVTGDGVAVASVSGAWQSHHLILGHAKPSHQLQSCPTWLLTLRPTMLTASNAISSPAAISCRINCQPT